MLIFKLLEGLYPKAPDVVKTFPLIGRSISINAVRMRSGDLIWGELWPQYWPNYSARTVSETSFVFWVTYTNTFFPFKGGSKSEDTGKILRLQHKYSKSLSWAENLNFPHKTVNNFFKFSAKDNDLEHLSTYVGVVKILQFSDLKSPLVSYVEWYPPFIQNKYGQNH